MPPDCRHLAGRHERRPMVFLGAVRDVTTETIAAPYTMTEPTKAIGKLLDSENFVAHSDW